MRLQMINVHEFARRLSTLGADTFTSDDVVDLATAADVRISADLEIDATLAQRLLDQISPALPVTGCRSRRRNGRHPRLPGLQRLRCRSPAPAPSTARLISRPDAAVLGLRVAVGDPPLDELAGELLSHHSRPSGGCRAWEGNLNLDRRACIT
jgi:hypothetical protein